MALKFGTFMAPFHCPVRQDPTVAYERDLKVIKHMDELRSNRFSPQGDHKLRVHDQVDVMGLPRPSRPMTSMSSGAQM